LLTQGHAHESFDAYRASVAQHPTDAVAHLRLAQALLEAGMGEGARNQAALAVKLDPKSAFAENRLAITLQSDLPRRLHRPGADYAGAAAAYRAAIGLDPGDNELVGDLAILLEHDAYGLRYGQRADLQGALATYGKLTAAQLADLGISENPAFAMFFAHEFAEALQSANALETPSPALMVACEAVLPGPPAASEEAHRLMRRETQYKEGLASPAQLL